MKLYADKESELEQLSDGVLFVERTNEFVVRGKVKGVLPGAEGKPSLNRAIESRIQDPKPGELPMGRLK